MDGALPSVVGGLVRVPVIAVPTSVGYGASFGGIAPLLTMLNSCAAGVTVVNIDNGFGAAVAAVTNHARNRVNEGPFRPAAAFDSFALGPSGGASRPQSVGRRRTRAYGERLSHPRDRQLSQSCPHLFFGQPR